MEYCSTVRYLLFKQIVIRIPMMITSLLYIEPVSASARERSGVSVSGGATIRGAHAMRGGGGAGLAAARVGGAGHRPRDRAKGGGGGGGANLDVVGEDWEGLVLQDTPIRGVAVATLSGTASKISSQPTSPG